MSQDSHTDSATEKVLAGIRDEELAARYPNRTHFISAENPHHGAMATRALLDGDPVVIAYADGHELLVRPEQTARLLTILFAFASFLWRLHWRHRGDVLQFPPRAHIEARDSTGHPIAA